MSLNEKLKRVMERVKAVNKTGVMGGRGGGYEYHTREDAFAVRPALVAEGVTTMTRVLSAEYIPNAVSTKNGSWGLTVVHVEVEFACVDTGETRTCSAIGHGADSADQGASKAQTNAIKNALLNTFLLGSEEHSLQESATTHHQPAPASVDAKTEIAGRLSELGFSKEQMIAFGKEVARIEGQQSFNSIPEARLKAWVTRMASADDAAVRQKIMKMIQPKAA